MNYRHAYHAGNHTEVFKHSVLVSLVSALKSKPAPFFVLDTHAGVGTYDLTSEQAKKTGEASEGIAKVYASESEPLKPYLDIVRALNSERLVCYPGSPQIIRSLLREADRLAACELHSEDVQQLRAQFRGDTRVAIHHRDGYEAMMAFVPPPERRGLIFIDPPFEERDEFDRLSRGILASHRKWPTGVFAAWYPIKDAGPRRRFLDEIRSAGVPKCIVAEFLRQPIDGEVLAGSGMLFINPPWKFDQVLQQLCSSIQDALGIVAASWEVSTLSD